MIVHPFRRSALVAVFLLPVLVGCSGTERSVRPGINKGFLDPKLDVQSMVQRFEGESREIFAHRARIAAALQMTPGMAMADVGAGTGLFLDLFNKGVGPEGRLYAVDIAPKFVAHIKARAAEKGYRQTQVVQCTDRSVELPANSVDLVFICDTYHHFEFPHSTMESIHKALRPGGRVVVVDFERIPGVSRKWVLDHVRAGKDVVTKEIESAGFRRTGATEVQGLRENYMIHFVRE